MRTEIIAVACLGVSVVTAARAPTVPTVQITNGTIEGDYCSATNVSSFLSVPYATPPTGNLRFAAPLIYNSKFDGTLKATTTAPNCIQFGSQATESGPQSEDCLYLNIWAPSNATSESKLPVKVWLYGGGDTTGGISDPLYQGCYLATDAVVVAVNYRLGPLGFLALEQANLTGNYGIQDQLLALQWVQENVGAFGGDPTQVVLFGQSAGAFDAWAISTLPQVTGLVKAVIMESGGGVDFATIAEAQTYNEAYVAELNCSATNITCLQSVSTNTLNNAYTTVVDAMQPDIPLLGSLLEHDGRGDPWGVLVDGHIIPTQPSQTGVKVPAIFGSNTNEGALFMFGQYGGNALSLNETMYDDFITYAFGPYASTINQTYGVSAFGSSSTPVYDAMVAILTYYGFRCPAYRGLLSAAQNNVPVYTYSFNHTPSCGWESALAGNDALVSLLGPTHTAEIPFVFGIVEHLPPPNGSCDFTSEEKDISTFLMNAWTSMATSGTPGDESAWPVFNGTQSQGINVEASGWVIGTVDYSMCEFWDGIATGVFQLDANSTSPGNGTSPGPASTTGPNPSETSKTNQAAGSWRRDKQMLVFVASIILFLAFC